MPRSTHSTLKHRLHEHAIALAACCSLSAAASAAQQADGGMVRLQLLPAHSFTPSDGREMDVPVWRIDKAIGQRIVAAFNTAQPPVVDYEHQTLHKETNGQPAPAAGWIHGLEWVDGQGLFARVELTQRAHSLIAAGEYRYFSPVFEYARPSGEITRILMGALTNAPAIAGMQALHLAQAASARFAMSTPSQQQEPTSNMDELLKKFLAALQLPDTATAEDALEAIADLQDKASKAEKPQPQSQGSAAPHGSAAASATTPDPAQFVPIAVVREMQTGLAALTASARKREVDDLVIPALADGRLLPALEPWARELGQANIAALSAYLTAAPRIAALSGTQTAGKPPAGGGQSAQGLTCAELAVAAACGLTPEQYAKGITQTTPHSKD